MLVVHILRITHNTQEIKLKIDLIDSISSFKFFITIKLLSRIRLVIWKI